MDSTSPLRPQDFLPFRNLLREIFAPLAPSYTAMKLAHIGMTAERLRPYRRFLRTLFTLVTETYLGSGIAYSKTDEQAHAAWCLSEAARKTEDDNCRYLANTVLVDYLHAYLQHSFYAAPYVPSLQELDVLLDPERIASRSDLNELQDLWDIFEATPRKGRRLKPTQRGQRLSY